MREIVTFLMALFIAFSTAAQTDGQVLLIKSNNLAYQQTILTSEVDSICYDDDNQYVHTIYSKQKFPLEEIEKISFENELKYMYVQNVVENFNGFFTEDGKGILWGNDKDGIKTIQYGVFDFQNNEWNTNSEFIIQFNDSNLPVCFVGNDVCILIEYNLDGTLNVIQLYDDGSYSILAQELTIPILSRTASKIMRAPDYGDVGTLVGYGKTIWDGISDIAGSGKLSVTTGLGAIGNIVGLGNSDAGFLISGTGDVLTFLKNGAAGLYGGALTLTTYLYQKSREFQLEHLGDWKIEVISAKQKARGKAEVVYSISGINYSPQGQPRHRMLIHNAKTGKYRQPEFDKIAENGTYTAVIDIPEAGEYAVEMSLYDNCHKHIRQLTYPATNFYMYDLGINHFKVSPDIRYSDGIVHFDVDVFLEGEETSLSEVKQFGYYVKFANSIDYHQVKNLSSIFSSTPLTLDLDIERTGFFKMDYTSFTAEATDYYIGAYVVDNKGVIQHFDEQPLTGLVYNVKPNITFTSAQATGTSVIDTYDDGSVRYQTTFEFSCDVSGSFWINHLLFTISAGDVNNYWDPQYVNADGNWSFSGWAEYTDATNYGSYFTIVLNNGSTMTSDNSLYLSCGGGGGSLTVSGSRSNSPSKVVGHRLEKGSSNYGSIQIK